MLTIQAPLLAPRVLIGLPSPLFADSEGAVNEMEIQQTIDGTTYTYANPKDGRRKIQFQFITSRQKAQEVEDFYRAFIGSELEIVDHLGQVWHGFFSVNPFDRESVAAHNDEGTPDGEMSNFTLEFEADKQ